MDLDDDRVGPLIGSATRPRRRRLPDRCRAGRNTAAVILGACLLIIGAGTASAGNDDGIFVGNDAALAGGAVVATGRDGSMLFYNPAGLTAARNLNTLDASGSAFLLRRYDVPHLLEATSGQTGDGSFGEFLPVPSAVTYVRQLGPHTTIGGGLFVPEAQDYVLRSSMIVSGVVDSRWQVALAEEFKHYNLGAGAAWNLAPGLMLGVSLFGTYVASLQFLQVAGGVQDDAGVAFGAVTDLAENTLLGLELNLGLLLRPSPSLSLGISLRSPGIQVYRTSRSTSFEADAAVLADGESSASLLLPDTEDSSLKLDGYAPLRVRLGIGWHASDEAFVTVEGDVQPSIRNESLDVDRVFTWNARVGGNLVVSKGVTLGAGLFTDRDPQRAEGAYRPLHFFGASLGARFLIFHSIADYAGHDQLTLSSTVALRFAHGEGKIEGVLIDDELEVSGPPTDLTVNEFTLHLGSAVGF